MSGKHDIKIIEDEEGKKIVVIPQIIFKGKRTIDWKKVEKYLKCYVGEIVEVAESEDRIYIERDFPDEFSGSVYTRSLRGNRAKAKANLVGGIKELLEIATSKRWSTNYKKKHRKNAENGWYRYNTRFALPILNEVGEKIGMNVYKATLIVRYSSNEKLYLYDIQDIKKETGNPLWT